MMGLGNGVRIFFGSEHGSGHVPVERVELSVMMVANHSVIGGLPEVRFKLSSALWKLSG